MNDELRDARDAAWAAEKALWEAKKAAKSAWDAVEAAWVAVDAVDAATGLDDIPAGTQLNTFTPDWDTEAVLVEEMQRMAAELKASNKIIAYQDAILMRRRVEHSWVGLTEERIRKIWLKGKDHGDDWADVLALAKAFDAELKMLNK